MTSELKTNFMRGLARVQKGACGERGNEQRGKRRMAGMNGVGQEDLERGRRGGRKK